MTVKEKLTIQLKFNKEAKPSEESPSCKYLLLVIVRLMHADPMLLLNVRRIVTVVDIYI